MFETNYSDFTIQMEPKRNHAKHNWFQVLKFVVPRYYEWVENWWTLLVVRPPFAIKSFSNAVRSKTACPRCDINNPKLQWYLPRIHDKSWQQESPKSSEQNPWRISGDFSLSGCACGGILADWKKTMPRLSTICNLLTGTESAVQTRGRADRQTQWCTDIKWLPTRGN